MKYRNLFTNILYVVMLLSLVGFLLAEFDVFGFDDGVKRLVATMLLAVSVLCVACIEIVFPVVANRDYLKNKKYLIRFIVKTVLLVVAAAALFLHMPFGKLEMFPALAIFVVTYFIQFFISLEPKAGKKAAKAPAQRNGSARPAADVRKGAETDVSSEGTNNA